MRVVSNTSPILGLAAIGHLDLLHGQFAEIIIPEAVLRELKTETNFRGTKAIRQALKSGWIRVKAVENIHLAQALALELDQGEAEAISLAIEIKSTIVLLDEHEGRSKARAMGLTPIGILGILLRAKKDGSVSSFKDAATALRKQVGFFIAEDLYQEILRQVDELD